MITTPMTQILPFMPYQMTYTLKNIVHTVEEDIYLGFLVYKLIQMIGNVKIVRSRLLVQNNVY